MSTAIQTQGEGLSLTTPKGLQVYYLLFFLSGFPALLYQIVWQRALFTLYGVNIESVTIIVTVFMLGLGLGSLGGGWLSARPGIHLLRAFGAIEISIGTFGFASLWIFHRVAAFTSGASVVATGLIAFALLLVPTMLMGSTLPLLVEHFVRRTGNVGETVGTLYSVNTFGSATACLFAALFIMRLLGESGSVRLAALLNLTVGITAMLLCDLVSRMAELPDANEDHRERIPLWIGMMLAAAVGFIALAYEIIWYRLYSFTSGSTAPCFAQLLAFYLFGVAYGSLAVRDFCRKATNNLKSTLHAASNVVILGAAAAFLLGPLLARSVVHVNFGPTFVFVFVAAALLGAAFPLLSHAAVGADQQAGRRVSLLYLSNIVGSTAGSFVVGFVILDHWSTRATSVFLLILGLLIACALAALTKEFRIKSAFAAGCVACLAGIIFSHSLFSHLYERLLFKGSYRPGTSLTQLVENKSGVIAIDGDTVYGGCIYDGHFNVDLLHDSNGLFRAFALPALHPAPQHVLIIGLSSGSWAQVVANYPAVKDMTIVEINPGYLPLIAEHSNVSSLLHNPKVHIVTDDGRRWLTSHPDRRFDFVLLNMTYYWRANSSNLLSADFLRLVRAHLNPGGVFFYNTTWSDEVQATGANVFPYAWRIANFLAVSDSSIILNKERLRDALRDYAIDGRKVFDLTDPKQTAYFEKILRVAEPSQAESRPPDELGIDSSTLVESRESMLNRLKGVRLTTDDNMGQEWRH